MADTDANSAAPRPASTSTSKLSSPVAPGLAWLVHSQDSVARSLPPEVDDKPLVRQKRRRTSPEDQKILEEEFKKNPKPCKWTRYDISQSVALNEKEIQIWFQNRRQNSRRKTQPLNADEQALLNKLNDSSDSPVLSSDGPEERETPGPTGKQKAVIQEQSSAKQRSTEEETDGPSLQGDVADQHDATQASSATNTSRPGLLRTASSNISQHASYETAPTDLGSSQMMPSSQDSATSSFAKTGYLANRRSASFVQTRPDSSSTDLVSSKKRPLERSSSLRLSMTSDGAAKVVNPFSPSPSPPRSQPVPVIMAPPPRSGGIRRSYSAAGFTDRLKQAEEGLFGRKMQRTSSGRSRDSRAWEFWCDSEARNSLTEKAAEIAAQEESGSAADAISLIRSNSKTAALKAEESKKKEMQARREAATRKKPGFSRATTALGRLPSETRKAPSGKMASKGRKQNEIEVWEEPNTDSDKENWEPLENGAQPRLRLAGTPQSKRMGRTVLGESQSVLSQNSSLGNMMARDRKSKTTLQEGKGKPKVDDEVASFMGQPRRGSDETSRSGSTEADLDCIQGLLSLSKGAWA